MGLAQEQRVLARLVTEPALRLLLLQDPERFGVELGLDLREVAWIEAISSKQLTRYADALRNKRRNEVAKLLPLSCRVLGETTYAALFHRHQRRQDAARTEGLRAEAIDFSSFAAETLRKEGTEMTWAVDLLKIEGARLATRDDSRSLLLVRLNHRVADLVCHAIEARPEPPRLRPSLLVGVRLARSWRQRWAAIPLPTWFCI